MLGVQTTIEKAILWANTREEVRALLLTGSRARNDHPGDKYADLDLELYVTDYNDYLSGGAWVSNFGKVWVKLPFQTSDGDPQFLVVYDGGDKVDFTFFPTTFLEEMVNARTLTDSMRRGYRVLVDKDQMATRLQPALNRPPAFRKPSQENFYFNVNSFWYGAVYAAKQIKRGNLWVVKEADWRMKRQLFAMLEWHAQAIHNWQYDTWHGGHFLPEWTDDQTLRELHRTFGHFHQSDSWQALIGAMNLFRRLASETAAKLGYNYPRGLDENVTGYVMHLFGD
jgi:aminoglycoside 6-adenylyltransferase